MRSYVLFLFPVNVVAFQRKRSSCNGRNCEQAYPSSTKYPSAWISVL